jgi:Zn-dependent protease with chaperone function
MPETDVADQRRLNPFAFPSETNVRFTLLVMAALMLALNLAQSIGSVTGVVESPSAPEADVNLFDPASIEQVEEGQNQVLTQAVRVLALLGALLLSILILAVVIYRGHPGRIRRNYKLRLMTRSDDAQFIDTISNLVNLSGLSPAPSVEIARGSRSVDGQAFGVRGHYALRLGGRLRLLLRQNPDSFRAIVLHELAHIANGDVARAYFVQAIWVAVVIVTIIPFIAVIVFTFAQGFAGKLTGGLSSAELGRLFTLNLPSVLLVLFQVGGTLAIVAAMRSSLLRIREVYADRRAALWGAEAPLADILRRNTGEDKSTPMARLLRLHPASQERLAALKNPDSLFRITTELPFFVGALLPYVAIGAIILGLSLAQMLLEGSNIGILELSKSLDHPLASIAIDLILLATRIAFLAIGLAVALGLVYLVAGALGLEVQRESIADMNTGREGLAAYFRLWKPAALVSIGLQIGILLLPFGYLGLLPEFATNARGLIVFLMILLSTVAIACLTWLWLVYIRFFAQRTLSSHVSTSAPNAARRLLTLASSGLLLVLYLPAVIGQFIIMAAATGNVTILAQMLYLLLGLTLIALFLYLVIFGATWLLVQIYRLFHRPHCPSCGNVTHQPYVISKKCEHCGLDLAPWLFVTQP